jgi:hypothetical protein
LPPLTTMGSPPPANRLASLAFRGGLPDLSHTGPMAAQAKLTIRVGSARGSSRISYSTGGRYISLATNILGNTLMRQPIQPTSSDKAFWESVLAIVNADIAASPLP